MSMRGKSFCIALIAMYGLLCLASRPATASPIVGAISWDGWTGTNDPVGYCNQTQLNYPEYQYRLPFYATNSSGTYLTDENTQAQMDEDIAYAHNAGLSYWAFVWYGGFSDLQEQRALYLSSSVHNLLNYCLIYASGSNMPANTDLITAFHESYYQTVTAGGISNRPLVYLLGAGNLVDTSYVTSVDTACAGATPVIPKPYFVLMGPINGSSASTIGCDATSEYWDGGAGSGGPYTQIEGADQANWGILAGYGAMIPEVTTGEDPRPRMINGDPGYPQYQWEEPEQPCQLAAHLQHAIAWAAANTTADPTGAILMYAWNESSENGEALTPTLFGGAQNCQAIAPVIAGTSSPDLAMLSTNTYWANSNASTAHLACDGSYSTYWSSSIPFTSNPACQVEFASPVTFDQVVLGEGSGSNRTSSFALQYKSGSTWYTCYNGTTIGNALTQPTYCEFAPVTASALQVYYTGGTGDPQLNTFEVYNAMPTEYTNDLSTGFASTNYTASSYTGTQVAANAFTSNFGLEWQATNGSGSGQGYNNSWLEVHFPSTTTFDKAVLAEYGDGTTGFGDRTDAYQIQYSTNGTSWTTAYTGMVISSSYDKAALTITNATNANPIVVTTASGTPVNFASGYEVNITGVGGNTNANTPSGNPFRDAVVTGSNTFQIFQNSGNANYTSGGTVNALTINTTDIPYSGVAMGDLYAPTTVYFPPVTGNYARILYTSGYYTPIQYGFQLYNEDWGFENPVETTYAYNPSNCQWGFRPYSAGPPVVGSGISANGSAFTSSNPNAPEGEQVAFLQGEGVIQTSAYLVNGVNYTMTFQAAQRASNTQTFTVDIAGGSFGYGVVVTGGSGGSTGDMTPSGTSYQNMTSGTINIGTNPTGWYTLYFAGTVATDSTAFIDNVQITHN